MMINTTVKQMLLLFVCFPQLLSQQFPEIYSYYKTDVTEDDISECEVALESFAQSSSNYTLCTLRNAHPIHMCQNCVDPYMSVMEDHGNIMNLNVNGTKCRDKLINLDRLQIVESTFTNIKDLWNRGFCDKCFEWRNNTPILSNQTLTFVKYFIAAKDCINRHLRDHKYTNNDTDEICRDCMEDYLTLNSYYESLKNNGGGAIGICMDIVDSMNATRSIWSEVLNCCKLRQTPEAIFLICTAVIAILPALFYFATRIFSPETPRVQVIGHHHFENVPGASTNSEYTRVEQHDHLDDTLNPVDTNTLLPPHVPGPSINSEYTRVEQHVHLDDTLNPVDTNTLLPPHVPGPSITSEYTRVEQHVNTDDSPNPPDKKSLLPLQY